MFLSNFFKIKLIILMYIEIEVSVMKIVRCKNVRNHFYDSDKYPDCPNCNKQLSEKNKKMSFLQLINNSNRNITEVTIPPDEPKPVPPSVNNDNDYEATQMMSSYEHLYFENDSFEGFIKKYSGGNYNFMAIVPKKEGQVGMEIVLDFLSKGDGYHKTVKNSKEYVVDASIPKFSLQSQGGMKSNLTQMNFGRSFSPTDARLDLLGTCDENLYIDDLYVYTGVTVTERGTSKGSGAIVRDSSVATNVIPVALDRPFIFAIVDNNRYLPIILGVVNSVNE